MQKTRLFVIFDDLQQAHETVRALRQSPVNTRRLEVTLHEEELPPVDPGRQVSRHYRALIEGTLAGAILWGLFGFLMAILTSGVILPSIGALFGAMIGGVVGAIHAAPESGYIPLERDGGGVLVTFILRGEANLDRIKAVLSEQGRLLLPAAR